MCVRFLCFVLPDVYVLACSLHSIVFSNRDYIENVSGEISLILPVVSAVFRLVNDLNKSQDLRTRLTHLSLNHTQHCLFFSLSTLQNTTKKTRTKRHAKNSKRNMYKCHKQKTDLRHDSTHELYHRRLLQDNTSDCPFARNQSATCCFRLFL